MTARWQTGTVACGGEKIYYEVSGDDDLPAIMLTHGAGGTHAAWFQQVPTLAATGFRVITWDCRGFGNSTFTTGVHGSAAAVADMAAVLDATGTPGAHLVGQSMGGWWVSVATGRSFRGACLSWDGRSSTARSPRNCFARLLSLIRASTDPASDCASTNLRSLHFRQRRFPLADRSRGRVLTKCRDDRPAIRLDAVGDSEHTAPRGGRCAADAG